MADVRLDPEEMRQRFAILQCMTDYEIAKLSEAETGASLGEGEEFIDLEHLDRGVQVVASGQSISSATVVPKSAVPPETWARLSRAVQHA